MKYRSVKHRSLPIMFLGLAATGLALSSCTTVATSAGVAIGTAAVQEGGISRALSDARIQTEVNDLWFRHNFEMFRKLDMTVDQGRILLTGVVQNPEHRVEAVRLAWQPRGVVQVINEVKVAESAGILGYAKDVWISTRLRSALILDGQVESINYSIDTVQGTVYLMGFAQDQGELNHVIDIARKIENVTHVVSYVKMPGTPETVASGAKVTNYSNQGAEQGQIGVTPAAEATADPIEWSQESVYD